MSVIQRSLVSDQVFKSLIGDILSGRYGPGEKLPTQRALAADLGVNMASVREAVKRLEQMRLIEVRQGDAMRVRDWRSHGGLDVIAHALFHAGGLDRSTLDDLLEARRLLLMQVARLAAERRSKSDAKRLRELAERLADTQNPESAQQIDWQFYAELAESANNLLFKLLINSLRDLYFEQATLFAAVVAEPAELGPLREAVVEAIEAADPDAAEQTVRALAQAQEDRLLAALKQWKVV